MQLHVRSNLPDQPYDAVVLHDHRVRSRLDDGGDRPRGFQQLVLENQRIEGDESAHASRVQSTHDLRQLIERKSSFRSCRKMFQTEIDRVRASLNRGLQLRPIAGRAHEFRLAWGGGRHWTTTFSSVARPPPASRNQTQRDGGHSAYASRSLERIDQIGFQSFGIKIYQACGYLLIACAVEA